MSATDAYRKEQSRLLKKRLLGRTACLLGAWTVAFALFAMAFQEIAVPRIAAEVESWCPWRYEGTLDPELDQVFAAQQREMSESMVASYLGGVDDGSAADAGAAVSDVAREALEGANARMQEDSAAQGGVRGGSDNGGADARDAASSAEGAPTGDAAAAEGEADAPGGVSSDEAAKAGGSADSTEGVKGASGGDDASGRSSDTETVLSFPAAVAAELADLRERDAAAYDALVDEALAFFGEARATAIVDMDSRGSMPGSYDWMVYLDGHVMQRDLTLYAIAHGLKVPLAAAAYVAGVIAIMWLAVRRAVGSFDKLFGAMEGVLSKRGDAVILPDELAPTSEALAAIAAQSQANEAAAHVAEQRKNELVAYLAHDIRTPLTSVVGYLTMLKESPDMPSEQRVRWAGIALDRACRLEGMLEEFFEITRYNLQSIPIERERFDAGILCQQVADEFFPAADARGITVQVEAASPLPVFADASKVSRVLNNLLKNAVGYADEGSAVRVRAWFDEAPAAKAEVQDEDAGACGKAASDAEGGARRAASGAPTPPPGYAGAYGGAHAESGAGALLEEGERAAKGVPLAEGAPSTKDAFAGGAADGGASVGAAPAVSDGAAGARILVIEVENEGREISPAHLQSIFEKFYREDASRGTGQGGAGLGLAIAREIASAHGGTLTARSEMGKTAFTLRIPA